MYVCFSVVKNLTDVFYLCIIMMAYGPSFVKATIHGIVLNTVQSLASLPEVMANGRLRHMHTFFQYSVQISTYTTCTRVCMNNQCVHVLFMFCTAVTVNICCM